MLLVACAGVDPACSLALAASPAVGQFRDLVEAAERNKALRETLKQVGPLDEGSTAGRLRASGMPCACPGFLLHGQRAHFGPHCPPAGAAPDQGVGHCT